MEEKTFFGILAGLFVGLMIGIAVGVNIKDKPTEFQTQK
jgi:hypothetical protein